MARSKLEEVPILNKKQKLIWEKEYLGIYVSDHPMQEISPKLDGLSTKCSELKISDANKYVKVAGVISSIKKIITKKGDQMLFAYLEDNTGSTEVLVFPKILEDNPHIWQIDNVIACLGKISDKDGEVKILCEKVAMLNPDNINEVFSKILIAPINGKRNGHFENNYKNKYQEFIKRAISDKTDQEMKVLLNVAEPLDYPSSKLLREIFANYPGNHSVELLIIRKSGAKQKVKTSFKVDNSQELIKKIENIIGFDRVVAS